MLTKRFAMRGVLTNAARSARNSSSCLDSTSCGGARSGCPGCPLELRVPANWVGMHRGGYRTRPG